MSLLTEKLNSSIIVCGHYGSGKTNVSIGLALDLSVGGHKTALVDLDIVNPYFRAADAAPMMKAAGISCLVPQFANTNVDVPSLGGEVYSVFAKQEADPHFRAVFDVGGDNGAFALGRYREYFERLGYTMIYVISMYRPLTDNPDATVCDLREIEGYARLKASCIINNSNLGKETSLEDIEASIKYADSVSSLTGLPVLCTMMHNLSFRDELSRRYPDHTFTVIPDSTKKLF